MESCRITSMNHAQGGSVAIAGSVYGHLNKTPNAFPDVPFEEFTPGSRNLIIPNSDLDRPFNIVDMTLK